MATKRTPENHLNLERDSFDAAKWDSIKGTAVVKGTVDKGRADLQTFPEMMEDTFNAFFKHSEGLKKLKEIALAIKTLIKDNVLQPKVQDVAEQIRKRVQDVHKQLVASKLDVDLNVEDD